jgi:hypothetical protein
VKWKESYGHSTEKKLWWKGGILLEGTKGNEKLQSEHPVSRELVVTSTDLFSEPVENLSKDTKV